MLLFGATRLPNAARQLGRSMRIFKSEIKEMKTDGKDGEPTAPSRPHGPRRRAEPLEGRVAREDHAPRDRARTAARPGVRRDV